MEVAGPEEDGLAGRQEHVVEQQRGGHAGVTGVAPTEAIGPPRRRMLPPGTGGDGRLAPEAPPVEAVQRLARAAVADGGGQLVGAEVVEQGQRVGERAEPAERLERRHGHEQLGLRLVVRVATGGEAGRGLRPGRMGLQRQRLAGGEHLEQVGQRAGHAPTAAGRRRWPVRWGACPATARPTDGRRARRPSRAGRNSGSPQA